MLRNITDKSTLKNRKKSFKNVFNVLSYTVDVEKNHIPRKAFFFKLWNTKV